MKLENWSLRVGKVNPYQPPEGQEQRLHGFVYGHPGFDDGTEITTSTVIKVDFVAKEIHTQNSVYQLGKIEPAYAQWIRDSEFTLKHLKLKDFE